MADSRAQLNQFLVEVFHDVMRLEEQELLKGCLLYTSRCV